MCADSWLVGWLVGWTSFVVRCSLRKVTNSFLERAPTDPRNASEREHHDDDDDDDGDGDGHCCNLWAQRCMVKKSRHDGLHGSIGGRLQEKWCKRRVRIATAEKARVPAKRGGNP